MVEFRSSAIKFIVLMGFVSLFADMTYEGGRSITSPYLAILGASATAVGFIFGFGELLGYALRYISGYIADKTKRFWTLTIIGYAVNLFAVPLLALAKFWEVAMLLVFAERIGKAIRTPARDAMISYASKKVGRGYSFGLHEALDQIGAVSGPLIVSAVLYFSGYREAFAILVFPAIASLIILLFARKNFPEPHLMEVSAEKRRYVKGNNNGGITSKIMKYYMVFVFFSVAGFTSFPIIAYHLKANSIVSDEIIPIMFAGAMLVDAFVAVIFGKVYDKIGFKTLIFVPILTILLPIFSLNYSITLILLGIVLLGIILGLQETILRAAVADLSPTEYRGRAYGTFNAVYGVAWFIGNSAIGFLYDKSPLVILYYVAFTEIFASLFLIILIKAFLQRLDRRYEKSSS